MIKLTQPSTWRGLALLGSALAVATGHGALFNAEMTEQGLELGGLIGSAVPLLVGLYDTVRDELKGA